VNGEVELRLVNDRVDVGGHVKVTVVAPTEMATANWRVALRCQVHSASPADVVVATAAIPSPSSPTQLPVPDTGPVTRDGVTMQVSWSVAVVDDTGATRAETPVVITPRGGVALWLQRHAPPPA